MARTQPEPLNPPAHFARAADMVSAQARCTISTAVVLMHHRAELIGCGLEDIATAVVACRIRFDP